MRRIARKTSHTTCTCVINLTAPLVPSPVAELLADLSGAFAVLKLPWYLFGAQAAIIYGAARLTADVDVTVRAPGTPAVADWLVVLEQHGFDPRFVEHRLIEQTRVLPLIHRETGLPTDVVLAGPGLEDDFLRRSVIRDLDGVAVRVIEITDLVILKVLAGRPKDVDDVTALLRINDTINDARAREVLGLLETALGRSGLLAGFEAARTGSRRSDRTP